MNEYDEECLQVFLEKQLQLFQEEVATLSLIHISEPTRP